MPILISIIILMIVFCFWQNNHIVISSFIYKSSKVPKGFNELTIAHISDLHNKSFGKNQKYLLDKLSSTEPDLIVITGDLIDRRRYNLGQALTFIEGAMEIAPVYYVSGNHEAWLGKYEDIHSGLIDLGVVVLDDTKVGLVKGNSVLEILGLSDPNFLTRSYLDGVITANLEEHLSSLVDYDTFQILLSHRPELIDIYASYGVDMIFSGHAHGGQFRIPGLGGLIAPDQGIFPKYSSGPYTVEDSTMYVSRGLGNSIIPIRIFNRPQIIKVTLYNE